MVEFERTWLSLEEKVFLNMALLLPVLPCPGAPYLSMTSTVFWGLFFLR